MRIMFLTGGKQDELHLDLVRLTDLITDVDNSNLYGSETGQEAERAYRSILTLSQAIGGSDLLVMTWNRITGRMRKRNKNGKSHI